MFRFKKPKPKPKPEPTSAPVEEIKFRRWDDPDPEWERFYFENEISGQWKGYQSREWLPEGYAWYGGTYGGGTERLDVVYALSRAGIERKLNAQIAQLEAKKNQDKEEIKHMLAWKERT